jgi:serine/threonine protein kinase
MDVNTAIILSDPKEIGAGSYGKVFVGKYEGKMYAVKRRYVSTEAPPGCVHVGEVDCLYRFRHPYIVRAKAIQRRNPIDDNFRMDKKNTYGDDRGHDYRADLAYVLTEAATTDIWKYAKTPQPPSTIRRWMWQILLAIAYIHKQGFIHRDIKPHNILYFENEDVVKVCDFDMCIPDIEDMESFKAMTPEYTPPEILSQDMDVYYTTKVDIWGAGMILKFLTLGDCIIKRGDLKDRDMDNHILALHQRFFPNGRAVDLDMSFVNIGSKRVDITTGITDIDDLLLHMLDCDPNTRWTAEECLGHRFFNTPLPNIPKPEDFTVEKHHITNTMAKVFDGELNSMSSRTWFGFFLGLDILARVCRTKYTGDGKKLSICCYNIGMKYYDKEIAKTIDIDPEDAKTIEYRIIVEKLQGDVYRDTVYNHVRANPLRLYAYLVSPSVYGWKFSKLVEGIKEHLSKRKDKQTSR